MRFLHTADWHIGQLFHEYDRTHEHQQFLNWLSNTLQQEQIDVLLISGDVFDLSNPSAISIKMFYSFLNKAIKTNPNIQIVITAGNHDSASRLETPKPLLESSNIHIIGLVEKDFDGTIDYEKLIVPLHDLTGDVKAWCIAAPFLRMGDYPNIADCANPYTEGVTRFYQEAFELTYKKKQNGQPVIAMGHLHTYNAEITDLDKTERLIMGGMECVPATAFNEEIKYVALGHIHKAQKVGGKEHIRYSGSVLPMSFSEINYKHQVIVFDLANDANNIRQIDIPTFIPLKRVPNTHKPLQEVITLLEQLLSDNGNPEKYPYLEVRVLLEGPEPALRHKVEKALVGKNVRLAKIDVKHPADKKHEYEFINQQKLDELQPIDVFTRVYQSKYNSDVPENIMQLFQQVAQEVNLKEETA